MRSYLHVATSFPIHIGCARFSLDDCIPSGNETWIGVGLLYVWWTNLWMDSGGGNGPLGSRNCRTKNCAYRYVGPYLMDGNQFLVIISSSALWHMNTHACWMLEYGIPGIGTCTRVQVQGTSTCTVLVPMHAFIIEIIRLSERALALVTIHCDLWKDS
jgi:hypothetical protein